MIRVRDSVEFGRLIKGLADDVVHANIHWKLHCDLHAALQAQPVVGNQSNTFWYLTLNAHALTAAQYLCRAFDQQKGALSLQSWLKTIRANLHLFDTAEFKMRLAANPFVASLAEHPRRPDPAVLNADIRQCSSGEPLVGKLMAYRNNVAAHRNANGTVAGTAAAFTVPVVALEALLERSRTVLNRYSSLFAAETHSTSIIGRDDYRFIFSSVADAVERSHQAMDAELARYGGDRAEGEDRRQPP